MVNVRQTDRQGDGPIFINQLHVIVLLNNWTTSQQVSFKSFKGKWRFICTLVVICPIFCFFLFFVASLPSTGCYYTYYYCLFFFYAQKPVQIHIADDSVLSYFRYVYIVHANVSTGLSTLQLSTFLIHHHRLSRNTY